MSFADDIRKNYVEKPKYEMNESDPFNRVANEIVDDVKKVLMNFATSGMIEYQYAIGKLGEKKYVKHRIGIDEGPLWISKEYKVHFVNSEHTDVSTCIRSYNRLATKKLYGIVKRLCAAEGIEVYLSSPSFPYYFEFKVYL